MSMETFRTDEKTVRLDKKSIIKRTIRYLSPFKRRIALAVSFMFIAAFIVIILPKITEYAIDVAVYNKDMRGLVIAVSSGAVLCVLWYLLTMIRAKIMAGVTNRVVYSIRKDAYCHLQTLGLFYFDSRPTGKILSRLINDISNMKDMLTQLVTNIIPNLFIILAVMLAMFISNATLALSALLVVPFFALLVYIVAIKGFVNWENYRKKQSNLNAFSHENYSGIRIIQAYAAEKEREEEFEKIINDVESSWNKAVKRADLMNVVYCISNGLGIISLYTIAFVFLGYDSSSVGELIAFTSYLILFWNPIRQLAMTYNQLTNNITAAGRVFEMMDTESTVTEAYDASEYEIKDGTVDFVNVSFAYPDEVDKIILSDVSFHIKKGERIALVGPTGAGKTTIINLVARFYDPLDGKVLIDGFDIRKMKFSSLRKSVAVMTQDPFIFKASIMENLKYGKEDATEEEVMSACHLIGADDFILKEKDGYNTLISSASLSQGQRQLIALVRTLLMNPSVIILDEATSSIDTNTEMLVQKGIDTLLKGRTSFTVAHRLSTIRNADRIFVIQDRGVAEEGTHEQLLEKENGLYRALYLAQFEEV
ncbi:MAG TPA: ABC transporter ATP-binding protein/permease [Candidatus Ornithospirochaeta avicola]|uniref:ABC transporter ATP-binding protein/permease n=1 Tax=Candidatus Ornithospirochaeta avicola TaxID=2840896 RepID=A0A9D1PUY6_9SPIO|nr:ABC transporter ATP-binding protein/permease [Candidatus Ornithospirochaeta avicola]